MVNDVFHQ